MRRLFLLFLILSTLPLAASIPPYSNALSSRVQVDIEEESKAYIVSKAFKEEYNEAWLGKYTDNDDLFALAYTPMLSGLLPMSNLVIAEEEGDTISFYSLDSDDLVSVIFKNGYIAGISLRKAGSQAHR